MKLKKYVKLEANIILKSGLHIGTGEKGHYGEPLTVIKSLSTELPYIPGSSIKGKMRHLLEITYCDTSDGKPCGCGSCQICLLFGSSKSETTSEPSRLIFRDCNLSEKSLLLIEKIDLEKKAGVRIDRKTGKAAGKALYALERVPEETSFDLEISARIFENDNLDSIKQWLATGLYFLEQDALGGGGTRGSGHIEFNNISFDGIPLEEKWREIIENAKDELSNIKIK